MKRLLKRGAAAAIPSAILLFAITVIASEPDTLEFGNDDTAVWTLSADSTPCNPNETGRVCAEWSTAGQSHGLVCCVSPSAIGSDDPGDCELLVGGVLALLPDRGPID